MTHYVALMQYITVFPLTVCNLYATIATHNQPHTIKTAHSTMDDPSVAQFVALTGASPETAAFFLESTNNNIEAAVDSFFASGGQAGPPPSASAPAEVSAAAPSSTSARPAAPRQPPATRNVRGFADIVNEGEEDDDDDHNEYYAGGEKR